MTGQAVLLQYATVFFVDLNRFVKILQGKGLGVIPAVFRLCQILGKKVVRQMAIYTRSYAVMAGLLPRVKLRLHDMAVGARRWVGTEVGKALAVVQRERADSQ